MSFADELQRIKTAVTNIKGVLVTKGFYDLTGKRIDDFPNLINSLKTDSDVSSGKSKILLKTITELTAEDFGGSVTTSIPNYSAYGCNKLKTVTIPNRVSSIGTYAFYGCSSLETVTLPTSLSTLSTYVFRGCSALKNINLQDTKITTLGNYVFYSCSALESIEIPSTVSTIATNSFTGCSKLKTIRIHKPKDSILNSPWGATNANVVWDDDVITNYKLFGLPSFQGTTTGPSWLIVPENYKYGDMANYGGYDNDGMFVVEGEYFQIDDMVDLYSEEDGLTPAIAFYNYGGTATYKYIEDIDHDRVIFTEDEG